MRQIESRIAAGLAFVAIALAARRPVAAQDHSPATSDSAYAGLQERGKSAMGVDQYTSRHVFEALPDGGRIELQRNQDDAEGT